MSKTPIWVIFGYGTFQALYFMKYFGNLNHGFSQKNIFDWSKMWCAAVRTAKRNKKVLVVLEMDKEELEKLINKYK